MEILPINQFDREHTIHDLLKNIDCERLHGALSQILNGAVRVVDLDGDVVFGDHELSPDPGSKLSRIALTVQL